MIFLYNNYLDMADVTQHECDSRHTDLNGRLDRIDSRINWTLATAICTLLSIIGWLGSRLFTHV